MKDVTHLLNLLALVMRERRFYEVRGERAPFPDHESYLEVLRLSGRIDYLASFIRSLLTHHPH